MTASLPPDCRVYVDGVRMADGGTPGEVDTDPVVLTDLRVTWGRDNTLDQPEPSTCTFTVLDIGGGARALDRINIGSTVDIVASAIIPTDPTTPTIDDPGFEAAAIGSTPPSSTTNATVVVVAGGAYGSHAARIEPVAGRYAAAVVFPPGPFSADPSAWDARPRSRAGQAWHYGLTVARLTQQLAGLPGVTVEVEPVGFTGPRADAIVRYASTDDRLRSPADAPAGWIILAGDTYPPDALWLGLRVVIGYGPAWDDVGAGLRWDDLGGAAVVTNEAYNPYPRSQSYWAGNNGAVWTVGYAGYEITVTKLDVTGYASQAASMSMLGNSPGNPVLPVGTWYQRQVEVWTDLPTATVLNVTTGGFTGGQALPAGQWTRVVQNFEGLGTARYIMGIGVTTPTHTPGMHVKFRRSLLVKVNGPSADPVPYFDGSTPDAGGIDYAWTGTANGSPSTATDTRAAVRWDDLGGALVDDLVMTAPAGGAQRQGAVFSGRVTDLEARYDQDAGGTLVDVTAESHLAELGNRYVGEVPWLAQSLADRFAAIVAASGQRVGYTIDPGVAGYVVSWRDVDAQPAARLLAELAQSCAGALWLATSLTTGPYLWLEDIDARPATAVLVRTGGVVGIVPNPDGAGLLSVSACDVLLDPVRWVQTTEDDSTRIAVRWLEQTLDDKGQPAPTERTATFVDDAAESVSGQRRIGLSTELTNPTDAKRVGDAVLGRVRAPGWRLAGVTIRLDLADPLDADLLSLVMTILDATTRIGAGLMLTDLPAWSPAGTGAVGLYLEGGRFHNVDGAWELELLTSDARAQGQATVRWDDLPGSIIPAATRTNRMTNPRAVAGGSTGWDIPRGWGTGGNGAGSYFASATPPPGLTHNTAYRKTWTVAATNNVGSGLFVGASSTTWLPATAGKTYTVSCYLRHTSGGNKIACLKMGFVNTNASSNTNPIGGWVLGPNTTIAAGLGWTRLTLTALAPAGTVAVAIAPDIEPGGVAWAVGNTLDCTALMLEESGSAGTYFDGSTADAPPLDYAWAGAANASTSTVTDTTVPFTGWQWDQFDPAITWNDLAGVGIE